MSKRKSSSTNEEDITKKEEEGENVTISTSHGVNDDVSTMMDVEVLTTTTSTTTTTIPTSSAEIQPGASMKTSNSVNMEQSNKRILRSAKKTKRSSVDGTDGHEEEGFETAPPTESVTEATTTATTTSTTTTRPVKRSRQQPVEGEEEVFSTSAQRHQPTSVQEILGTTAINSSISHNAATATTKGIGRVSLRLPHEQQLLEDNASISTTTVKLLPQQQQPTKLMHWNLSSTSTTSTQITSTITDTKQHQVIEQERIKTVTFSSPTPTSSTSLSQQQQQQQPHPSPFQRLVRSSAQLYATPLRPAVVAALEQQQQQQTISGTTTTQTSAQRHRLLAQGIIISESLPKINRRLYYYIIACVTVLMGITTTKIFFNDKAQPLSIPSATLDDILDNVSNVVNIDVGTTSTAENIFPPKELTPKETEELPTHDVVDIIQGIGTDEPPLKNEQSGSSIEVEDISVVTMPEIVVETKLGIDQLLDNEGQERLEEGTITTEPVADTQQVESNTPPVVDQPLEISPEQIEDATSVEEVNVVAMEGRCSADTAEEYCVESERVVDITQESPVDEEMPAEVIVETKLDSEQLADNEGKEEMEEGIVTTEAVAHPQKDESNAPPLVDQPPEIISEQIENATSAEEVTVAVMVGKCSADSTEEYCVKPERVVDITQVSLEEDKGLVNGTAASSSFAQDENLCGSARELIDFYKNQYEKITGEAHAIQGIISEKTHHIDQWEGALRMAEEAIAKLNSSSSNEDILQAHFTLKRLIAISPIPIVNMVTLSEIKLPSTMLPPCTVGDESRTSSTTDEYVTNEDVADYQSKMTAWAESQAKNFINREYIQIFFTKSIQKVIEQFKLRTYQTLSSEEEEGKTTEQYVHSTRLTREEAQIMIEKQLRKQAADRTGEIDYAAIRQGGSVIRSKTSRSYADTLPVLNRFLHLLGLRFYGHPPEIALSVTFPLNSLGQCWAFGSAKSSFALPPVYDLAAPTKDDEGMMASLTVKLAKPVKVKSFVIEHPLNGVASFNTSSAIRNFRVYGYESSGADSFPLFLGEFSYEIGKCRVFSSF
jgi:hypothetical protein